MNQNVYLVSVADEGKRLDQFLKERTGLTRSEVQKWIKAGNVSLLPKKMIHSNYHVSEGDRISFFWEEKKKQELIGQNIPLDILYEDNDMIVINKRRGVVVHPGAGNTEGTLVNALLLKGRGLSIVWIKIHRGSWWRPNRNGHMVFYKRKLPVIKHSAVISHWCTGRWKAMLV